MCFVWRGNTTSVDLTHENPAAAAAAAATAAAAAAVACVNKGTPIKDLDPGFVHWLCKNFDFDTPAKRPLLKMLVAAGKVREGPSGQLQAL
jgi:ADP-ribosylglycohydrolase